MNFTHTYYTPKKGYKNAMDKTIRGSNGYRSALNT